MVNRTAGCIFANDVNCLLVKRAEGLMVQDIWGSDFESDVAARNLFKCFDSQMQKPRNLSKIGSCASVTTSFGIMSARRLHATMTYVTVVELH